MGDSGFPRIHYRAQHAAERLTIASRVGNARLTRTHGLGPRIDPVLCMRTFHAALITVAMVVHAQIVHVTTSTTVLARLARLRDPDGDWLVKATRGRTQRMWNHEGTAVHRRFTAIRERLSGCCARFAVAGKFVLTRKLLRLSALCGSLLMLSACVGQEHMSFLDPQGPVAHAQMVHFYWVLGIMAVFVAGPIFLGLPLILWRYRYRNRAAKYTPKWRDNGWLVLANWAGPVAIVMGLGFFVWRDAPKLDPYTPLASNQPALQVQVIGYDWKWLFIYPDQRIATIGTFVVPVGRPVTLHLTSATVMQSFFIPALGSQIYAMGGMVTQLNLQASQPGCLLGENTMYNGNGFHFQKFTTIAMQPGAFAAWIRKVKENGVPLDAKLLDAIGRRNTREQLVTRLPPAVSHNGSLYFTDVSPRLFPDVVMATMKGIAPATPVAGARSDESLLANPSPRYACMESEEAP